MKLFLIVTLSAITAGCAGDVNVEQQGEPATDGVFIHITAGPENPHRVLMALQMANIMAETQDVLVYLDIEGVKVVLNDAEDIEFSHFATSHAQIRKLIGAGATVMACPGCLKVIDKTGEDLMDGVQVADKAKFFSFTEGRILTLDY
ncbi:MAG: peroxiredoxin [candidate division Zixibacteria bacterium]|nr:peroxiredoxin [candidate division Zixibacteria bacterium]